MEGSHEFLLIDDFSGRHGQWVKTNTFATIDDGKLFAPGNLRGTQVGYCLMYTERRGRFFVAFSFPCGCRACWNEST